MQKGEAQVANPQGECTDDENWGGLIRSSVEGM
jgi:hypothetical protein